MSEHALRQGAHAEVARDRERLVLEGYRLRVVVGDGPRSSASA